MFPSRSLPSEYSWGAMLIFPSWRERAHWVVLNVNCMNFCTFSFSSCLLRRRRICPNITKACCYAGLAYKQHLIKISLSNLMFSRVMWFSFILYWIRWSHFITTNIFNNILKCEFLGLTSSVFPIDEAQAMRCLGYIFVLSPVSLVWAVTTSAQLKSSDLLPIISLFVYRKSNPCFGAICCGGCWDCYTAGRWDGILLGVFIYLCVLPCPLVAWETLLQNSVQMLPFPLLQLVFFFHHPLKKRK